jgi:hypothetical protein
MSRDELRDLALVLVAMLIGVAACAHAFGLLS